MFFVVATMVAAYGQQPEPPAPPKTKVGYLRFWNMLPPANGTFDLRRAGASASETLLFGKAVAYRYSSYRDIPVGRYNLVVHKTGDEKSPLKAFTVDVKDDSYFTVLIAPQGDQLNVELMDDTIDPKAETATLTIRNFFPGLTVSVTTNAGPIVDALAYGQKFVAANLRSERMPLSLRSRLPDGTPTESNAEADFVASKRGTLLIIPDSYGRFRPRVTIDGKNL